MPRHVRFPDNPVSNVRTFESPSPASSTSSLPPSPGPSTPPPLPEPSIYTSTPPSSRPQYLSPNHPPHPTIYAPSPQVAPGTFVPSPQAPSVYIHPALAAPSLAYDVLDPPTAGNPRLPASTLASPATHPPLPALTLQCPALPWSIHAAPPPGAGPGAYVAVADVLNALYAALRLRVKGAEYHALAPHVQKPIRGAFEARCARAQAEREKGLRRVDFLAGRTRVEGLVRGAGAKEDVWLFTVR